MTMMDRSTRWLEATPVPDMAAANCADTLGGDHIRQGNAIHLPGLDYPLQEAGHPTHNDPQSNGLVERAHCQLKEGLKTRLASHEWPAHLPWVLLGM
jgi:hypothetical protein